VTDTQPNHAVIALVKAAMEMANPQADSKNAAFKRDGEAYRYASLNAVLEVVKPTLAKHGLALFQPVSTDKERGFIEVQTMFMHTSGGQVTFPTYSTPMTAAMTQQAIGGSISYMRRYALQSALGLAADDNDAEDDRIARQAQARTPVPAPSKPAAPAEPATARRADHVPAKPAAPAPARTMGVDVIGTVVYVKSEPGEKNGKPYTKHRIGLKKQGDTETTWLTSFSDAVGEAATAENKTGTVMCGILGGKSGDLLTDLFPQQQTAHVPAEVTFGEEIPF
jgi:pyruvate/2-oxoglutarate dehydrogenase complex dihydrolipoamide acyltransferase (E2) component